MDDDRARHGPLPPLALVRRLRARVGWPTDPRLPRPRTERLEPLHRSWLAAAWQARAAVRARLPLDDYLRSRLARYLSALPVPHARLPLAVEIRNGDLAAQQVERAPSAAPAAGERWLAALVALEGPGVRQEQAALELRVAALEGRAEAAHRRVEALQRQLAADVAVGVVAGPPAVVATPEQLGRPPVRSAGLEAALVATAATSLLAETWQLALPLLQRAGLEPVRLRAELAAHPAEALLTTGYALGVAVALFALAQGAVEAAARFLREEADPRQRRWLPVSAGLSGVAAAAVAAAGAAALPVRSAGVPAWTSVSLLLAVPLGSALLLRRARRAREARDAERAAALAWDRERAWQLADRARRQDEVAFAEAERAGAERDVEAGQLRRRALNRRAAAAARLVEAAERRERLALAQLAQSLVGALERDRHEFLRQASARGELELLLGRRKAPEPPRSVQGVLESVGEGGRLAG
jgi:hypothetical protein